MHRIMRSNNSGSKEFISIYKKTLYSFGVAILLVSIVLIFGPSSIYFNNYDEFNFTYFSFLTHLAPSIICYTIFISLFFFAVPQKRNLFKKSITAGMAFSILLWAQGNIFVWDYGVFDGSAIDWSKYTAITIIDGLLWVAVFCFIFFKNNRFFRSIPFVICGLLVFQLINTFSLYYDAPSEKNYSDKFYSISYKNQYVYSDKLNIVIMVLDTFETSLFKKVLKEQPSYTDTLDGFIYSSNAVSLFPTTMASIPSILTGKVYKNRIPFRTFLSQAYESESSLFTILSKRGFTSETYGGLSVKLDPLLQSNISLSKEFNLDNNLFHFSLFRQIPNPLKQLFYEKFWNLSIEKAVITIPMPKKSRKPDSRKKVKYPENFHKYKDSGNLRAKYEFEQLFTIKSIKPVFKYFHFPGAHLFNYKFAKANNRFDSAIHSLDIVSTMISQLKKNSIYDKTVIIITSDHGLHTNGLITPTNFNPILLIKPLNSRGYLYESTTPISIRNIPDIALNSLSFKGDSDKDLFIKEIVNNELEKQRICYHYDWQDSWEREYLPNMVEYSIEGKSIHNGKMVPTGRIFSGADSIKRSYTFGTVVDFRKIEQFEKHAIAGWRFSEDGIVSIPSSRTSLGFQFDNWLSIDHPFLARVKYTTLAESSDLPSIKLYSEPNNYFLTVKPIGTEGEISFLIDDSVLSLNSGEIYLRFYGKPVIAIKSIAFTRPDHSVPLGKSINFGISGKSFNYCIEGWSHQEPSHRWTNGSQALLRFELDQHSSNDLLLRLRGFPYLAQGKIDHQKVDVIVNNQQIATWVMREEKWEEALIPSAVIGERKYIDVLLKTSTAASPADFGSSTDSRKLGIGVMELVLDYVK